MTLLGQYRQYVKWIASTTLVCFSSVSITGPVYAQVSPAQPTQRAASSGSAEGSYSPGAMHDLSTQLQQTGTGTAGLPPAPSSGAKDSGLPELPTDVARSLAALPKGTGDIAPQAISLPGGPGSLIGMGESFAPQLSTGVATYTVPLVLPHARGLAQPALSLSYASSSGFGAAGHGWSVGAAAISRQLDRGTPRYDDRADWYPGQDRFVLGATELVPLCTVRGGQCNGIPAGEVMPAWAEGWQYFRPRLEAGYQRCFWAPNHRTWRVQSKDGIQLEFGVPLDDSAYTEALEANPEVPSEIYRWHLVREYDAHGDVNGTTPAPLNGIVYRYRKDGGVAYLSDIYDTPPIVESTTAAPALYAHHTALRYEARADTAVSYRTGFRLEYRVRVAGIDITSKPFAGTSSSLRELVRRYHFTYDPGAHTSLLSSLQMEGRCATPLPELGDGSLPASNCPALPELRFDYQRVASAAAPLRDSMGLSFEPFHEQAETVSNSPPHSLDEDLTALGDITGDGLPDVLVTAAGLYGNGHGLFVGGGQAGNRTFSAPQSMAVTGVGAVDANVLSLSNPNVSAFDLDADGRIDLVHMPQKKTYEIFSVTQTGGVFSWLGRSVATADQQDVKLDFSQGQPDIRVMDVNADGLVDLVYSSPTEYQTFFSLGRYPGGEGQFGQAEWTSATTAAITTGPVTACAPWSGTTVRFSDPDVRVADMNGDGFADIVRLRSGQLLYWPGRGNGFWGTGSRGDCLGAGMAQARHIEMTNAPAFGTGDPGSIQLADVNGDGLADLVEVRLNAVDVYLNDNGAGWTSRHVIQDTPVRPNGTNPVRVADLNGSGTPDLVWGTARDYRFLDLAGGKVPYLLTRVRSGFGKTTELEYATSTDLMLAAQAAGTSWSRTMPLVVPVVVRQTVRDNLELVGRTAGVYVTEFGYRDPVYLGLQREFRGFQQVDVRRPGDTNSPTRWERLTFHLGECPPGVPESSCQPAERWMDNPRDALRGLPVLSETVDTAGIYQSTVHQTFELAGLYTGLDGRRVVASRATATDTYLYDTTTSGGATATVTLAEVELRLDGTTQTESRTLLRRATTGSAHTRTQMTTDRWGNTTSIVKQGCIEGCSAGADETITQTAEYTRPSGDASGWTWRQSSGWVTGQQHPERRTETRLSYSANGDLLEVRGVLSGTEPLVRFHATPGKTVAPTPADASGGATSPVEVLLAHRTYDAFGNVTGVTGPSGRCMGVAFDSLYAELPVTDTTYVGARGANGCGATALSTRATYDRGLGVVVTATSATGQPSRFDYDGLGRMTAKTMVDPANPGSLAAAPAETFEYRLPSDTAPYARMLQRTQDGDNASLSSYRETYTFVDGLGRTLGRLRQADRAAGDAGDWIVDQVEEWDVRGNAALSFHPWFYAGAGADWPLADPPSSGFTAQLYDAFDRPTETYGPDGQIKLRVRYHALSADLYDAEDLASGLHQGTYATRVHDGHGRKVADIGRIHAGTSVESVQTLTQYLPTGQIESVTQRRAGSTDVVRWLKYDTFGRMVLNVEPNTSPNYARQASPGLRAWRYAYNDAGNLVGTSDARGCGINYYHDAGGRLTAEDYSPCESQQPDYTSPDFSTLSGLEVYYRYDSADPESASIVDARGQRLDVNPNLLAGRLASVADRAAKRVFRYDAVGRGTGVGVRLVKPGTAANALSARYAPRWYVQTTRLDAAGRARESTTGAPMATLAGNGGASSVTYAYSKRGVVSSVGSSYGSLIASRELTADGLPASLVLGDLAATERNISYDVQRRPYSVRTERTRPAAWQNPPAGYQPPGGAEPTGQLVLEDQGFEYDLVGNITKLVDRRPASDWPATAKPVTRSFEYDDFYRVTRAQYQHGSTPDTWKSPYAAENSDATRRPLPSPHVSFDQRVREQRWSYDWLGNLQSSTDDANGFFDRSLGTATLGTATAGPNQLRSATNRSTGAARRGDLSTAYDAAGNLTDLIVRRDGPCLPSGASCWQRFKYQWDERGQLTRAQRWDLASGTERTTYGPITSALPTRTPNAEMDYAYDAGGGRVLKTSIDAAAQARHTLYVFPTLELRSLSWSGSGGAADYALDARNVSLRLFTPGGAARVVYSEKSLPTLTSGKLHVLLELGDHQGSITTLIDRETGELVEQASYQAYGDADSSYRPARWDSIRESYGYTDKETDLEVGLTYFGARYYSPALGRWISPDPLNIHRLEADWNPYAYVSGRVLVAVDPNGEIAFLLVVVIGIAIGALIAGGAYMYGNGVHGKSAAWWKGLGTAMGIGGLMGGAIAAMGAGGFLGAAGAAFSSSATFGTTVVGAGAAGLLGAAAGGLIAVTVAGLAGNTTPGTLVDYSLRGMEAGGLAGAGAVLGYWAGAGYPVIGSTFTAWTFAGVAALNGGLAGGYRMYSGKMGWAAFISDSTWSAPNTLLGLGLFVANAYAGSAPDPRYTERQDRFVFTNASVVNRDGTTLGNTVAVRGAGSDELREHETLHIWQERVTGIVDPLLYGAWWGIGELAGAGYGWANGDQDPWARGEEWGYYCNPFEYMAYQVANPEDWKSP